MRAIVVTVAVVAALLFLITQLFVPPYLEARLSDGLLALSGGAPVRVQMSSFPAVRMLTGSVQRLDVSVQGVPVGDLRVDDLQLHARRLDVDVGRLLRGDPLPVRSSEQFAVRAVVTERALREYVEEQLSFPGPVDVQLTPTGVELGGQLTVFNNEVPVTVTGRFEAEAPTFVVFVVEDVEVQGAALPPFMVTVIKETYTVRLDLSDGPLPLFVDGVVHEPGRLVVEGRLQPLAPPGGGAGR